MAITTDLDATIEHFDFLADMTQIAADHYRDAASKLRAARSRLPENVEDDDFDNQPMLVVTLPEGQELTPQMPENVPQRKTSDGHE